MDRLILNVEETFTLFQLNIFLKGLKMASIISFLFDFWVVTFQLCTRFKQRVFAIKLKILFLSINIISNFSFINGNKIKNWNQNYFSFFFYIAKNIRVVIITHIIYIFNHLSFFCKNDLQIRVLKKEIWYVKSINSFYCIIL